MGFEGATLLRYGPVNLGHNGRMQRFSWRPLSTDRLRTWTRNPWIQNLAIYGLAFGIIYYLARDVPIDQLLANFRLAHLWIFIPACVGSFAIWFVGETVLYSRLFTYFHSKTTFREMIWPNAAQYFLQLVNLAVAGSALVLFVHRRKAVPWLAAGMTLLFQAFIDLQILLFFGLMAGVADRYPLVLKYWFVPTALLALMWLVAWFFSRGRPAWRPLRWVYDRPSLVSFRQAGWAEYGKLAAIRAPIFAGQGVMLYFQMMGFGIAAPVAKVLSYTPIVLLLGGLPITPVGLGPLQAVLVSGFHAFATKANLLAMALSISFMNIIFRIPMGLSSAGSFAREVVESEREGFTEKDWPGQCRQVRRQ